MVALLDLLIIIVIINKQFSKGNLMTPLIAAFKKVKFLYQKLVSAGFTNRRHIYHMLDYKTPPSEIAFTVTSDSRTYL